MHPDETVFLEPYPYATSSKQTNKQTRGYFLLLTAAPGFQQVFDADLEEAGVLLAGHAGGIQRAPGAGPSRGGRRRRARGRDGRGCAGPAGVGAQRRELSRGTAGAGERCCAPLPLRVRTGFSFAARRSPRSPQRRPRPGAAPRRSPPARRRPHARRRPAPRAGPRRCGPRKPRARAAPRAETPPARGFPLGLSPTRSRPRRATPLGLVAVTFS